MIDDAIWMSFLNNRDKVLEKKQTILKQSFAEKPSSLQKQRSQKAFDKVANLAKSKIDTGLSIDEKGKIVLRPSPVWQMD